MRMDGFGFTEEFDKLPDSIENTIEGDGIEV